MFKCRKTEAERQYKYFAFISYSSKDVSWGKRLQKKLEHYRLPSRLQKKYKDTPTKVYPVFRDDTDLSGFKVRPSLERELNDSQYLIVICSPRSAESDWVNDEIQYFIDHGKEDRILPFIIEGVPYSGDPQTECFPPVLRMMKELPLGVDVQVLGKQKAYLRMISTLLNVGFDELVMRDRRRRIRNSVLAGCFLAVSGGIMGYKIWNNMEHTKYYDTYIYRNEIPVGVHELSEEERKTSSESYRITTLKGKVIRMETVNSKGIVIEPDYRTAMTDYPVLEYQYDGSGVLNTIIQKDTTGIVAARKDVTVSQQANEMAIDFRSVSGSLDIQTLSADMTSYVVGDRTSSTKSEITRQYNEYNEEGYLIKTSYQQSDMGISICDSNGVYGKSYEYNEKGQVIRISNLDKWGEVFNCRYGWAYEAFLYDENGNEILSQYYDADGQKVRGQNGFSAAEVEYDEYGNIVKWKALDENGQLVYCRKGYAVSIEKYDEQGMRVSSKFFDTEGNPVYNAENVHEYRYEYDESGRRNAISCYDTDGNLMYSPVLSYASKKAIFDEEGHILEERCLGIDGNPVYDRINGTYGFRYSYDAKGYCIKVECLDAEGNAAINRNGTAICCIERDSEGRVICEESRDENGRLLRSTYNVAITEATYDIFGNLSNIRYLDENENPCYFIDGFSSVTYTYENGNLISEKYYDIDGNPITGKEYYHEVRMDYDENGNCVRWSYYDEDGKLTDSLSVGTAIVEQKYDCYGNVVEKTFYTGEEKKALLLDVYKYEWEYDQQGNCIREELHSSFPENLNYVVSEMEYDVYGNRIKTCYYDQYGELINSDRGISGEITEFDERGNLLKTKHLYKVPSEVLDTLMYANEVTADTQEVIMYEYTYDYDDFGNQTKQCVFKRSDSGEINCVSQVCDYYDSYGNSIQIDYLDGEGNFVLQEYGYASIQQGYSSVGNVIWQEYYDENQRPCLYNGQAFRFEWDFDTMGRTIETRRFDENGELLKERNGWAAITRYENDVRGIKISESKFNEKGDPFGTEDAPVSMIEYNLDSMGYIEAETYYDKYGRILDQYRFYVYAGEIYEDSVLYENGAEADQFIIQYGNWNYFQENTGSSQHALRSEVARTHYIDKEVVLCEWTEEDDFVFKRYYLPEGMAGIRVVSGCGNEQILEKMEKAYNQWMNE